ncbi:hypothetical protein GCM10010390_56680 [Streptomyces mordarskii]|uniref:Uncharacterized protein n=1 Tax=Streptomyces mordarskii TaxID=1226758 RepID=A0ABN1DN45_9ACTN
MVAGNWRRITRPVYSGNRAAAHIIASHRLPPFEPLSGAAPKSSPFTPPVRDPGRRRRSCFSRDLVRRFRETAGFGFLPAGGAARLRHMPVVTGRARWVIRRTPRYALPSDAGPGAHGGAGACHEPPVGHRARAQERPGRPIGDATAEWGPG